MNCTGNCNQGRNCTCCPIRTNMSEAQLDKYIAYWNKRQTRLEWAAIAIGVFLIAAFTTLIELLVTGSVYWMPIAWGGLFALIGAAYTLGWAAGKAIDVIDWMTRMEG